MKELEDLSFTLSNPMQDKTRYVKLSDAKVYFDKLQDGMFMKYQKPLENMIWKKVQIIEKQQKDIEELKDLLIESGNQIQYLHKKFKETGSGNQVLSKITKTIKG